MVVNDAPACAMTAISHSSDWYSAADIFSQMLQGKVNKYSCMWRQGQQHSRSQPDQPKRLHHAKHLPQQT